MKEAEESYLEMKADAERTTTFLSGDVVHGSAERKQEGKYIALIKAEESYQNKLGLFVDAYCEAVKIVDGIADAKQYAVIHKKYIEGKSWEQIAEETGQTARNCQLICKKALSKLER